MEENGRESDEQAAIKEDFETWKTSTPFLYDLVMTHPLECSSLTVEWLPKSYGPFQKDYIVRNMILGTNVSKNKPNYLMIARVRLPVSKDDAYDKNPDPDPHYDESRADLQGFRCAQGKVEIIQKINHAGWVIRARYMNGNPWVVATKTTNGEIYVFDCRKHPSEPPDSDKECRPDLRLKGHIADGFGLSWNYKRKSYLLSGSDDGRICYWDLNAAPTRDKTLSAMQILKIHEGIVEDVAWHLHNEYLFGSVGHDKCLHISDLRSPTLLNKPALTLMAHQSEIVSLSFSPFDAWMVATGSADKSVKIFDLRKLTAALHTLEGHRDEVHQVSWSWDHKSLLASGCLDRRVILWDISRIGAEQSAGVAAPEFVFVHEGHTRNVSDLSWNDGDDWTIASVAEDSTLQIWKMAKSIYHNIDEEEDDHFHQPDLKRRRQV